MDQLLATDGHRVSSVLPTHLVFKSGVPVWKYQVVQLERDKLIFYYLVRNGDHLSKDMQDLLASIFWKFLGNSLQVEFVEGGFEVAKSGKHRFVINRVPEYTDMDQRKAV